MQIVDLLWFLRHQYLPKYQEIRSILKIKENYDVGSGYPSDSTTVKFVNTIIFVLMEMCLILYVKVGNLFKEF